MKGSDLRKIKFERPGKPKDAEHLADQLEDIFAGLGDASVVPDQAKEMANVAGKIIKLMALQHEYRAFHKNHNVIPFLE
jgi:hypothetical protein